MEILQNTIIQTLFRQGADSERQTITLKSGEPGFTTDTRRLYVGDGVTAGGILVGNIYKGEFTDVSTLVGPTTGDLAFNETNNTLYVLKGPTATEISSWKPISDLTVDPITTPMLRTWAVYNGATETVLSSSSNVASITRHDVGKYEVVFDPKLPDLYFPTLQVVQVFEELGVYPEISFIGFDGAKAPATSGFNININYDTVSFIDETFQVLVFH